VCSSAVVLALGGVATNQAIGGHARSVERGSHPRVTNRCPVGALPLRKADLPALRRFGLALAPHGIHKLGSRSIDYRDAHAFARVPTFYTGYVRSMCPTRLVKQVIARTADVSVGYPHVNWSASLSSSTFLISRTSHGLVGWAQMH
jgi:hypothetical protein